MLTFSINKLFDNRKNCLEFVLKVVICSVLELLLLSAVSQHTYPELDDFGLLF